MIVVMNWDKPYKGCDAGVWKMADANWGLPQQVIDWAKATTPERIGHEIIEFALFDTNADAPIETSLQEALDFIAINLSYTKSNENLWETECPILKAHGITRS